MGNKITEMVFIIDKSGSMAGYESDTVGGFNSMISRQREAGGKVYVSTVLFSNRSTVLHDRVDIIQVKPMTEDDYRVGGGTALIDAIGSAIRHIGNVHKYARPEDVPESTVFIITTDGMENASYTFDSDTVKDLIKRYTEEHGWEFIFLAANIDAVETAGNMGIRKERAMNFEATHEGVRAQYRMMSDAVLCMRSDPNTFKSKDIKNIKNEKEKN